MAKRINESVLWNKNSDHFWKGGWQLYASFSQSFFLQFLKSQCPFGSKYPEFSKTPPTFAFWMSLRVVMAIFPRKGIFLRHPVHSNTKVGAFTQLFDGFEELLDCRECGSKMSVVWCEVGISGHAASYITRAGPLLACSPSSAATAPTATRLQ